MEQCATCAFWRFRKAEDGQCFRYPPTPVFQATFDGSGNSYGDNLRPWTNRAEFCGEWRAR
jgi:hypothetical protein